MILSRLSLASASAVIAAALLLGGMPTSGKADKVGVAAAVRPEAFSGGAEVVLKSQAHVVGDIHHQSLTIEKGAYFEGRAIQAHGANGRQPERATRRSPREAREADAAAK